jgi:hypothetical protein
MSSSCLALSRRSAKEPHSAAPSHKTSAAGNRKADSLRVSPGKIVQAQGLLIQGHSRRSVSRSLHMSEHTVAKIVRTADFQKFLQAQRERLFAVVPDALESFRAAVKLDGRLAHLFLKDIGVVPSTGDRIVAPVDDPSKMTKEDPMARQTRLIAAVIAERHRVFNIELPDDMQAAIDQGEATESTAPHL